MSCSFNFKSGGKNKCNTIDQYLPSLQLMNKERERKEEIEKREERKRMKECNPECMTVHFLREVLEKMGEPYSKSWKKTESSFRKVSIRKHIATFPISVNRNATQKQESSISREGDRKFGWQGQHAVPLTVTTMQQYP